MKRQPSLNLYGKGIHKTSAGHLRYHSPRELRGRYVHRKVIDDLLEVTPFSVKLLLPWPYEVHHQDYNKEHNCGLNLLILDERLHSSMTADRQRDGDGRFGYKFKPRFKPAPDWVLFRDDSEVVPF
jgi:hypothetical protein